MEVPLTHLPPGDPRLVDAIVGHLKSKGIFDKFRKECLADVDTKPAFQNLRQRVDGQVKKFLETKTWKTELNKNHLRDGVRKNILDSGILDTGIDAIINQIVNPKIKPLILPYVEDTVYSFLSLEKPNRDINEVYERLQQQSKASQPPRHPYPAESHPPPHPLVDPHHGPPEPLHPPPQRPPEPLLPPPHLPPEPHHPPPHCPPEPIHPPPHHPQMHPPPSHPPHPDGPQFMPKGPLLPAPGGFFHRETPPKMPFHHADTYGVPYHHSSQLPPPQTQPHPPHQHSTYPHGPPPFPPYERYPPGVVTPMDVDQPPIVPTRQFIPDESSLGADTVSSKEDHRTLSEATSKKLPPTVSKELESTKMEEDNAVDSFDTARREAERVTKAVQKMKIEDDSTSDPTLSLTPVEKESKSTSNLLYEQHSLDSISSNSSGLSSSPTSKSKVDAVKNSTDEDSCKSLSEGRSSQSTPLVDEKSPQVETSSSPSDNSKGWNYTKLPKDLASTELGHASIPHPIISGASPVSAEDSQDTIGRISEKDLRHSSVTNKTKPQSEKSEGEISSGSSENSSECPKNLDQSKKYKNEESSSSSSRERSSKDSERKEHRSKGEKDRKNRYSKHDDHSSHREKDRKYHRKDKDDDGEKDKKSSSHHSYHGTHSSSGSKSSEADSKDKDKYRGKTHNSSSHSRSDKSDSKHKERRHSSSSSRSKHSHKSSRLSRDDKDRHRSSNSRKDDSNKKGHKREDSTKKDVKLEKNEDKVEKSKNKQEVDRSEKVLKKEREVESVPGRMESTTTTTSSKDSKDVNANMAKFESKEDVSIDKKETEQKIKKAEMATHPRKIFDMAEIDLFGDQTSNMRRLSSPKVPSFPTPNKVEKKNGIIDKKSESDSIKVKTLGKSETELKQSMDLQLKKSKPPKKVKLSSQISDNSSSSDDSDSGVSVEKTTFRNKTVLKKTKNNSKPRLNRRSTKSSLKENTILSIVCKENNQTKQNVTTFLPKNHSSTTTFNDHQKEGISSFKKSSAQTWDVSSDEDSCSSSEEILAALNLRRTSPSIKRKSKKEKRRLSLDPNHLECPDGRLVLTDFSAKPLLFSSDEYEEDTNEPNFEGFHIILDDNFEGFTSNSQLSKINDYMPLTQICDTSDLESDLDFEGFKCHETMNADQKLRNYLTTFTDCDLRLEDFCENSSDDELSVCQTVFAKKKAPSDSPCSSVFNVSSVPPSPSSDSVQEIIIDFTSQSRKRRFSSDSSSSDHEPLAKKSWLDGGAATNRSSKKSRVDEVKTLGVNSYSLLTPEEDRTDSKEFDLDVIEREASYSPLSPSSDTSDDIKTKTLLKEKNMLSTVVLRRQNMS